MIINLHINIASPNPTKSRSMSNLIAVIKSACINLHIIRTLGRFMRSLFGSWGILMVVLAEEIEY